MFALTRAGFAVAIAAALFAVAPFSAKAADKPFVDSDLADSAVQARSPDQERRRSRRPSRSRNSAATPTRRSKNDFRTGMALLGQIVAAAPDDSATWLRLARTILQIRPVNDRERATLARARLDRGLHRLSAHHQPQRGGRRLVFLGAPSEPAAVVAAGARCAAAFARAARGRRRARPLREDARGIRLPRARLYRRCRYRLAARLLPVLRGVAGARTDFSPFVVVAGTDKPALSADDKQLCVEGLKHGERYSVTLARRPAVDGEGDAVEIGGLRHLCARPQAGGALRRQGLCAAAHRPARHSGGQRQHQGGRHRDLSHQRPQSDRRHRRRDQLGRDISSATSTATRSSG